MCQAPATQPWPGLTLGLCSSFGHFSSSSMTGGKPLADTKRGGQRLKAEAGGESGLTSVPPTPRLHPPRCLQGHPTFSQGGVLPARPDTSNVSSLRALIYVSLSGPFSRANQQISLSISFSLRKKTIPNNHSNRQKTQQVPIPHSSFRLPASGGQVVIIRACPPSTCSRHAPPRPTPPTGAPGTYGAVESPHFQHETWP